MDNVIIESFPVLRLSKNGNVYVRAYDGLNEMDIQFHGKDDVKALVTACGGKDAFRREVREYGANKWVEFVGPRARIEFSPTGKTESAVFARLVAVTKPEATSASDLGIDFTV